MKYKITTYILAVITAILLLTTGLIGFKIINMNRAINNSTEESSVSIIAINEKDNSVRKSHIFSKTKLNVLGKSLGNVLKDDNDFVLKSSPGLGYWVESIGGIKSEGIEDPWYWSIYSSSHYECKNNPQQNNQCSVGISDLYLGNSNEFTFVFETYL